MFSNIFDNFFEEQEQKNSTQSKQKKSSHNTEEQQLSQSDEETKKLEIQHKILELKMRDIKEKNVFEKKKNALLLKQLEIEQNMLTATPEEKEVFAMENQMISIQIKMVESQKKKSAEPSADQPSKLASTPLKTSSNNNDDDDEGLTKQKTKKKIIQESDDDQSDSNDKKAKDKQKEQKSSGNNNKKNKEKEESKSKKKKGKDNEDSDSEKSNKNNESDKDNKKDDDDSDDDYYTVEAIRDRRKTKNGSYEYLVRWQGYEESQNTWEPLSNLENVRKMVKEFDKQFESKNKKSSTNDDEVEKAPSKKVKSSNNENNSKNTEVAVQEKAQNPIQGSFADNDVPIRIKGAKMNDGTIRLFVDWKKRQNGVQPEESFVSNEDFKIHYPMMLIEFYESRVNTKKNNS